MMKKVILVILLLAASILGQDVKFFGEFKQGSIVIGIAEDAVRIKLDENELNFDSRGIFTFGFDRDDNQDHLLNIKFKDGSVYLKKIVLTEKKYDIQRINNMKQKYVSPPKEESERIKREREIINEARSKVGQIDSALFSTGFVRPVAGGRISSVFGSQRILNGTPKNAHNGIDIAAPRGTPVYAMADGVVLLAADNFYYSGNFILLDHGLGLNSVYLHLSKKDVKEGEFVKKGEKIGEIGTTGRSTGPHLHWGTQWYSKRVDPKDFLEMNYPLDE